MEQEVTVKKRIRPTWKQVRELEAKIVGLEVLRTRNEVIIHNLKKENEEQDVLINRANKVHEEGLVALRNAKEAIESLQQKVNELMIENERLRNRSFLERAFNTL